jgi:hypothetical protein
VPAAALEESLALPDFVVDEAELAGTVLLTNRAPVVLAFGVVLLQYTMPEQPLSSRLSLAQAVVSMNSRSKAVSLGLESGKSAEEEGWGTGQGGVKVLGRSVRTMRRAGWRDAPPAESQESSTVWGDDGDEPPAFWALDLEALKKSADGTAVNDGTGVGFSTDLPIYTPQSARAYLLKAFDKRTGAAEIGTSQAKKKTTKSNQMAEKERNLALLLGALDLLFKSWSGHLSRDELDSKAWSWYVRVRPDVASGISGWGAKGELKLADILQLRKT